MRMTATNNQNAFAKRKVDFSGLPASNVLVLDIGQKHGLFLYTHFLVEDCGWTSR